MRADPARRREQMVAWQIDARGIRAARLADAMRKVPRERFVPAGLAEFAYDDSPLPIDAGQTISQPYVVALMTAALELDPDDESSAVDPLPVETDPAKAPETFPFGL